MKELIVVFMAVIVAGTCAALPAVGQGSPDNLSEPERYALAMKSWVKRDAESHPKWRELIRLQNGSSVIGRIREARENDFVLEPYGDKPSRTIAYSDVAAPPKRVQPLAEKIAERTGMGILYVIFFPVIVIWGITGGWQ